MEANEHLNPLDIQPASWSKQLLERLIVAQLFQKFRNSYGT
jgi:hypothetical protein